MIKNQRTIVIIDDCAEDRVAYHRYLQQEQRYCYQIVDAEDSEEGLAVCTQAKPDLILLDYMLPGMDGLELLAELKMRLNSSTPPIVMMTGQGDEVIAVQAMKSGAQDYLIKGKLTSEGFRLALRNVLEQADLAAQLKVSETERQRAEKLLQQQVEWQRLVMQISQHIRQSLNLNEILSTAVEEVRQFLQADRVFIYQFRPDWSGTVVVESIANGWRSILNSTVEDTYFKQTQGASYRQKHIQAIADIHSADLTPCHINLLTQFQIRANLVVPIFQGNSLWGLFVTNQCSNTRQWQSLEIELLQQLATQVGIAVQQSMLFEQAQNELVERNQAEKALRQAHDELEKRVEERTIALTQANAQLQQEIQERQQAEEDLHVLSAALESAVEGISQLDPQGRYLAVNSAYAATVGYLPEEMIGTEWQKTVHPDNLSEMEAAYAEMLKHGKVEVETRGIRKDGSVFYKRLVMITAYDRQQQFIGHYCFSKDISERKQSERTIREQAALLDFASDAIHVRDLSNRIVFWNQGAERLFGWQAAEAIGQDATKILYKTTPPEWTAAHHAVLEKGHWQGELHKVTKSGKEVIVACRLSLVRDEAGLPKSILAVDTDITEKKHLEAQFLRTQRLENLGTLASGIAHDLNNILTPILAVAQLLPRRLPNLDGQNQQMLKMLEDNVKRGADLVRQILSFARGVEGKRTPLQVRHLLSEVEQIVKGTFPKTIQIHTQIPTKNLWTISGDSTQLHQVLMNLCINARDAMPDGGILTMTAENRSIDETFVRMTPDAKVGSYVVITVSDTGMGMSPELLDRIFDPFFTTKEMGKGTGLGLSTVIGIVKSHGGFVNVYSEVGNGSRFQVYLPTVEESTEHLIEQAQLLHGNGELVLIVDDEASIRETTKTLLEDYHYRTLTASDGNEAIGLYTKHQQAIQAILMDLMMPSIDGIGTIRILQQLNPNVKVIATSGLASHSKLAELARAGVETFLPKPYTLKDLLQTLHSVLRE